MIKFIMLATITTLVLSTSSFARDYKKDEVIKQEIGVTGSDANEAVKTLMEACMGLPLVESKLADLISITDVTYEEMHNEIMAFGTCSYKIKMDLKESNSF